MTTLQSFYNSRSFDPPDYEQSASEIAANLDPRLLPETLEQLDRMEVEGGMVGFDMADLMSTAYRFDALNRTQARAARHKAAAMRLCRIIAKKAVIAATEGDIYELERLTDALVLAGRSCY